MPRCHHHTHHWEHIPGPHGIPPGKFGFPLRGLLHLVIIKILSEKPLRGIDIKNHIKEKFGFEIPSAAVYVILKNLEERGLVFSKWDRDPSGSPVKLYETTSEGKEYLKEKIKALKGIKEVLNYLTEEAG